MSQSDPYWPLHGLFRLVLPLTRPRKIVAVLKTHDKGAQAAPKEEKWKPIEKTRLKLFANLPLWRCAWREGMSEQLEEVISDLLAEALVEDFLSNPPKEEESVAEVAVAKG